jgi:hypothetical protein
MSVTTDSDAISDVVILAAIERAQLHRTNEIHTAVPSWSILDHLEIGRRSAPARHVRSRIMALEATGALERMIQHGVPAWTLTAIGRRQLQRARKAGDGADLPESPQHRTWRIARTTAGQEIERLHSDVHDAVEAVVDLLDAPMPPGRPSDDWFEIADRLRRVCRTHGSAIYCLYEWTEPTDDSADVDDTRADDPTLDEDERMQRAARRTGRRNVRLWHE